MKRFGFFLLVSGLFWTGCIGNDSLATASVAQRNVENLARLCLGMTSSQVFQIMRQPYRNEKFGLDEDLYEIWFYITNMTLMDQKTLTHINLTPLMFKNRVLEGKGYNDYYKILNAEMESEKKPNSTEDPDLEKALNAPQKKTPVKRTQPPQQIPPPNETKPAQPSKPATKPQQQKPQGTAPTNKPKPSTPPQNTQPPAQKKQPSPQGSTLSMSTSSSNKEPPSESSAKEKEKEKSKKEKDKEKEPPQKVPLSKEDKQMLDREQDENFDFW